MKGFLFKKTLIITVTTIIALGLASCGSTRHTARQSGKSKTSATVTPKPKKPAPVVRHINIKSTENPVTANLLKEADSWLGTPYLWGGNDRNGVDCSGFVLQVYLKSLEIDLPRNSARQQEYCSEINKDQLRPGDLVFFTVRGSDKVGHVGIYIGEGNMIHSSSSKGVVITPLDNPYFVRNYHSSGRVEKYYALMDKARPSGKKPSTSPSQISKSGNLMAKADKKPAPQAAPKAAPKPKPKAKSIENPMEKPHNDAPLPSQVFASRDNATETKPASPAPASPEQFDEEEPDPDFFD